MYLAEIRYASACPSRPSNAVSSGRQASALACGQAHITTGRYRYYMRLSDNRQGFVIKELCDSLSFGLTTFMTKRNHSAITHHDKQQVEL